RLVVFAFVFFFSSRRRHTRFSRDWSSDVCSSDLELPDPGTDNAVDACNTDNAFNLFNALGGTPDAGGVWTDEDGSGAPITGDIEIGRASCRGREERSVGRVTWNAECDRAGRRRDR